MIGEASTLELTGTGGLAKSRWKLTGSGVSRLMVFQGTESGIGTTLVSFAAAVCAARVTGLNVGYLSLGSERMKLQRYLGITKPDSRSGPTRGNWTFNSYPLEAPANYCSVAPVPNLTIVYGDERYEAKTFDAEKVEGMLSAARSAFDICIVDMKADLTDSAVHAALMEADACVAVAAPLTIHELKSRYRSRRADSPAFRLNTCFDVLVNQAETDGQMYSAEWLEFSRANGVRIVGQIPWHQEVADRLYRGRMLELLERNHPVGEAARKLFRTY